DGRHFLFVSETAKPETTGLYAGSLDGTPPVRILPDESTTVYAPARRGNGYLLFRRESSLMAQPFDPGRLRTSSVAVALADDVGTTRRQGGAAFSASEDGTLAYQANPAHPKRDLVWMNRAGTRLSVVAKPDEFLAPALSPDGKTVAFAIGDPRSHTEIWLQDLTRGTVSRFTTGLGVN